MSMVIRWLGVLVWVVWAGVGVAQESDPGEGYFQRGQFELAVQEWEKARAKLDPEKSPEKYVDLSVNLAVAYQSLGQLKQALKVLRDVADKTNDSVQLAKVLIQLGEIFLAMPDKSSTSNQSNEDDYVIAVQACNSTTVKRNVDKARDCLEVAIKKVGNDNWLKATAKNSLGNVLVAQQKYCEAVSQYEESISSANKAGDNLLAVNTSINLIQSLAMQENCQVKQKLEHESVLQRVNKLSPSHDKAFALISLAKLAKDLPVPSREQALREALTIAKGLNDKSALAYAKLYLADLCLSGEKKADCYSESIDLLKGAIDYDAKSYPKINIEQGRITNADSFVSDSFGVYWPPSSNVTPEQEKCKEVCKVYSSPCVQDKLPKECKEVCRDVTPLFLQDYHPELSFRLAWQLGKIYKAQYDTEKQRDAETQGGKIQKEVNSNGQARLQMAFEAKAKEQLQKTIGAYDSAVDYLQMMRRSISQPFGREVEKFAMEWIDLLIQSIKNERDREKQKTFLKKLVSALELFKKSELQNYFQDYCIGAQPDKDSDQVLSLLPDDVAVFYPILLEDDSVELLLVSSNAVQLLTERMTEKLSVTELTKNANSFRQEMENIREQIVPNNITKRVQQIGLDATLKEIKTAHQKSLEGVKNIGGVLYEWLIKPVTKVLNSQAKVSTLVIVPDGILRTIPFAALYNKEKGIFFVQEQYALAVVPGLTLTTLGETSMPRSNVQGLLNGLSESIPSPLSLPGLKAGEELEAIAKVTLWGNKKPKKLENQSFTISELESELQNNSYSIVHLATHGQFKKDPLETFLVTYDFFKTRELLKMGKLQSLMRIPTSHDKPVELLTLSACESAMGDDRAALGMAGVAIDVGVKSALGTLWLVNDKATRQIMEGFYQNLGESKLSKAQALQKAQKNFLEKSPVVGEENEVATAYDKRHPYYWGAFLLIGKWQ